MEYVIKKIANLNYLYSTLKKSLPFPVAPTTKPQWPPMLRSAQKNLAYMQDATRLIMW